MVDRGRTLLADLPNVALHATDGALPMFADESLDLIFSFVVFQHIPSKQAIVRYLRESARVLKPGGVLKFQVDGRARPFWRGSDTWLGVWFRPQELRSILASAGFAIVDSWGESTQYYWLTARRPSPDGAKPVYAEAIEPQWNHEGLNALLTRLGVGPTEGPAIIAGHRTLREFAHALQRASATASNEVFVREVFQAILHRPADATGLEFYTRQLEGKATRSYVIDCLLASAELRNLVRHSPVTTP